MKLNIIGVTGTNGKTTVSYMLRSIFDAADIPCGIIGTTGHSFGELFYQAINTTPGEELLLQILDEMEQKGAKACAVEVSSHGLAQGRVKSIPFQYAIFTNLTQDHLDYHKTMEDYFQAKKKLFDMSSKANIINTDDFYGTKLIDLLAHREKKRKKIATITYSIKDKNADYYCEIAETTESGSKFSVYHRGECFAKFEIHIPGIFMIYNALAAISCAAENGISHQAMEQGLGCLSGVPGRFQLIENDRGFTALVDYAHTPDALEKLLSAVSQFCKGRVLCVFGCGGDRDREKRPLMGEIAGTHGDYVIITSDNPRSEGEWLIIEQIEKGILPTDCPYEKIKDRRQAIERAVAIAEKEDVIVVAGKGHETYQRIGEQSFHFDDREVLREAIKNYGE